MTTSGENVAQQFSVLPIDEKRRFVQQATQDSPGLFDLDRGTRRVIWASVFIVLLVVAVFALSIILRSYSVNQTTVTVSGTTRTTSTSHPDVSAAWAVVSAVVAGVVGLLVPSPTSGKSAASS